MGNFTLKRSLDNFVTLKTVNKRFKFVTGKVILGRDRSVKFSFLDKSGMADYIWKEKGNYPPLWDEVEINA